MLKEYSSGGVVHKGDKVLLVKVQNLKGERLWTFPKGHLEKGETARQAALREVEEETGYRCRVESPLMLVRYFFRRKGELVAKRVRWYRMEPEELVGKPDAEEVLATKWVKTVAVGKILKYPSDKKLLECFLKKTV